MNGLTAKTGVLPRKGILFALHFVYGEDKPTAGAAPSAHFDTIKSKEESRKTSRIPEKNKRAQMANSLQQQSVSREDRHDKDS